MNVNLQKLILINILILFGAYSPVYSQTNYGVQNSYVQTTFFRGYNIGIFLRNTNKNYYIQYEAGAIFNKNHSPFLSISTQLGNYVLKKSKKFNLINELNLTYGKFEGHGVVVSSFAMSCNTGKMTMTLNTGVEYKIWEKRKISISTFGKVGLGSALLVETNIPNCKGSNSMFRLNLGGAILYNN